MKTSLLSLPLVRACAIAVLTATAAAAATAQAQQQTVITFDGLENYQQANPVTSYLESGYSITAPIGSAGAQTLYGSSGHLSIAIFGKKSFTLTANAPGDTFTFDGFEAYFLGDAKIFNTLSLVGSLDGVETFTTTIGSPTAGFASFASGSGAMVFDTVKFTAGSQPRSIWIDDIRVTATSAPISTPTVTAVPEPGTYALMGLGLLAIGYTQRRRVAPR